MSTEAKIRTTKRVIREDGVRTAYVTIPEDVKVEREGLKVRVEGPLGKLEKDFSHMGKLIEIQKVSDNAIRIVGKSKKKKVKALVGTLAAHIRNMITGVTKGYTYYMRIYYTHFPVKIRVDEKAGIVYIENLFGERYPRMAKILPGVKVKRDGKEVVTLTGIDKEAVSQTAANIEQATRLTGKRRKDQRKFLDGVYIRKREVGMNE